MQKITLTLIRGLPGSGKTTLAKQMDACHLEADMYFMDNNGHYKFDAQKLKKAHQWCLVQCEYQLKKKKSVVIANTFVQQWEMQPYRLLAEKYKVKLNVIICTHTFENLHKVPKDILLKMEKKWQE